MMLGVGVAGLLPKTAQDPWSNRAYCTVLLCAHFYNTLLCARTTHNFQHQQATKSHWTTYPYSDQAPRQQNRATKLSTTTSGSEA